MDGCIVPRGRRRQKRRWEFDTANETHRAKADEPHSSAGSHLCECGQDGRRLGPRQLLSPRYCNDHSIARTVSDFCATTFRETVRRGTGEGPFRRVGRGK